MMLDRFIEILKKNKPEELLQLYSSPEKVQEFLTLAPLADKFSFGRLMTFKVDDTKYRLDLTKEEIKFWDEGLIPLPSELTWYEFEWEGGVEGMLICQLDDGSYVFKIVHSKSNMIHKFTFIGVWLKMEGDSVKVQIQKDMLAFPRKQLEKYLNSVSYYGKVIIYLTLMLSSKTTEVREERPPPKLNKARVKAGKAELSSHRIVTIVPKRFIVAAEREVKGTHASPRLHKRRSHIRTIHSGTPNEKRIVIAQMLVGKRENGEVSHEYRVKHESYDQRSRI